MYGEPRAIREVAHRLRERAHVLRADADGLVARSEQTPWVSLAADRMRAAARERAAELRGVARDYDDAADLVLAHAARVAAMLELVAEAERRVRALVQDAADRVGSALSDLAAGIADALTPGQEADRRLATTVLPPPGHRDWVDVARTLRGARP